MKNKATKDFVEKYYNEDKLEKNKPESIWAGQWAKYIKGEAVLNVGCGPQFYDDALEFSKTPTTYIGLDINQENLKFLKQPTTQVLQKQKQD